MDLELYELARRELRALEPFQPDNFRRLECAVIQACEDARRYTKDTDPHERRRRDDNAALDEAESVRNALESLLGFLERHPLQAGMTLAVAQIESGVRLRPPVDMPLAEAAAKLLAAWADPLRTALPAKRGPWLHRCCVGPLLYPEPVDRHSGRPEVALTGLLFQLVFLFRRFTHGVRDFDHIHQGEPMPRYGRPNYRLAALFAEAALDDGRRGCSDDGGHRLRKLLRDHPGMGWFGWPRA